jgi:hypothetical protein
MGFNLSKNLAPLRSALGRMEYSDDGIMGLRKCDIRICTKFLLAVKSRKDYPLFISTFQHSIIPCPPATERHERARTRHKHQA